MCISDVAPHLVTRRNMARYMITLDCALDSLMKEELLRQREADPATFCVEIATDESPPSQRRFAGCRFQVSVLYYPSWSPCETWDTSVTPPLRVHARLLDACHAPGKEGQSVMRILDKHLGRVGLTRFDIASMTGDGGGENEGKVSGMHSIFGSRRSWLRATTLSWTSRLEDRRLCH